MIGRTRTWAALAAITLLAATAGCRFKGKRGAGSGSGSVTMTEFGEVDGTKIQLYTLTGPTGLVAKITNYGTIVTELHVPDRNGKSGDVVLGHDKIADYVDGHPYFGATAGRVANRIANGKFTLGGKEYKLATNNAPNHLHGGKKGFDKHVWKAEIGKGSSLTLTRTSPDGEEGYPGSLTATVVYTLTKENEFKVEMTATTDAPTPVNLAHHTYWNLAGHGSGDIKGHELTLQANRYTPTNATLIPTGKLNPVKGTPFDFTSPKKIGADLAKAGGDPVGYDLNYVVNGTMGTLRPAARVYEPGSGRVMTILTTEPGIQFYSGNFLNGSDVGKGGAKYEQYNGFCLETQHYPDSINKPAWPTVVLKPGETYRHVMVHRFSTK